MPARSRTFYLGSALLLFGALLVQWHLLYFWTDDAFIAFRYAHHLVHGHGPVWNPAPFLPVEGYTSPSFVFLVAALWTITGFDPTYTANVVLFGCGALTFALCAAWLRTISLPPERESLRPWIFVGALASVAINRNFATWMSSGLETGYFSLLVLSWAFVGVRGTSGAGGLATWSTLASLCAVTRPDGLLFAALTGVSGVGRLLSGTASRREWVGLAPLLAVPAHLLWRWSYYGMWLPNTYYAKHVEAWPEAGAVYLASYTLEQGVWVWVGIVAFGLAAGFWRGAGPVGVWLGSGGDRVLAVGAALLGEFAYYTFSVGGDHFEYRVYHALIAPMAVAGAWCAARLPGPRALAPASLALFVLAAQPIAWGHFALTRDLDTRKQTIGLRKALAPHGPAVVKPVLWAFDETQRWLIGHNIAVRHQEHKVYLRHQIAIWPSRVEGLAMDPARRDVLVRGGVGWPGWAMPNVLIIDRLGLNDRVVAQNPHLGHATRRMAHDRKPPPGYVECFFPSVILKEGSPEQIVLKDRRLSEDRIRHCESRAWIRGTSKPTANPASPPNSKGVAPSVTPPAKPSRPQGAGPPQKGAPKPAAKGG